MINIKYRTEFNAQVEVTTIFIRSFCN